jgi:hypothetical protein
MSHWLVALLLLNAATVAFAQAPHLDYSILLGGTDWDEGTQIAVDATGHAWLVGATYTWDFPFTTPQTEGVYHDLFIARLSPAGALLSAIPFGGSETDYLHAIHLDTAGNLYLVGQTWSPDFPVTHLVGPPGAIDSGAFVAKVDPAGNLVYSTRFRGTPNLAITDVAVDAQGQAHVVGNLPVSAQAGAPDMFIAKLSADGSSFLYSLQLGGSSSDEARGIALDSAGNAHVAGLTYSANFPQAQRLPQNGAAGFPEAVVLKLGPAGSRIYSKLLGGGGPDAAEAIAIDPAGNALVYGGTGSPDFPVRDALQPQANFVPEDWNNPYREPYDSFLTRLDPAGALLGSTFLGGTSGDSAIALSVDPAGFIYLLGSTFSAEDFPLRDPLPAQLYPPWDYAAGHVTLLDPQASEILFSTFLDGTDGDEHGWIYGMAVDAAGSIYLSGTTHDPGFPVVGPSPKTHPEYFYDAFAVKIDPALNDPPVCSAATASPAVLGTPYGWFRTVTVQGVTDPDGDRLSAIVTRITQDELLSRTGEPDARGVGTVRPSIRADRMSSGDGRVYHLTFTASDPEGATCSGRVTVCVPVDSNRPTCRDGGARFVSSGTGR